MTPIERKYADFIAKTMRLERERKGLTQGDVAQVLGVSQSAISKYETAALTPSVVLWFDFCLLVGIDPCAIPTTLTVSEASVDLLNDWPLSDDLNQDRSVLSSCLRWPSLRFIPSPT